VNSGTSLHQNLDTLIQETRTGVFDPKQILELVDQILWNIDTLNTQEKNQLRECVHGVYIDIKNFAQASSESKIKKFAGKCAFLLDNENDMLDFYYDAYRGWDIESFLTLLTNLEGLWQDDKVSGLLYFGWNEWKKRVEIDLWEKEAKFLQSLITFAYRYSCDDIADEIIALTQGWTIYSNDVDILRFRKVVRTPEEYILAMNEILTLYFIGKSRVLSLELLKNVQEYVRLQIQYLNEVDEIEPLMLDFLENLDSEEGEDNDGDYDFNTKEGKNYFALKHFFLLAILYSDRFYAHYILKIIESNPDIVCMLSDIVIEIWMIENDGWEIWYKTQKEIVFEWIILHILKVFGWIEDRELHERIYRVITLLIPYWSQDFIDAHRTSILTKEFRLGKSGLEYYYHPFVTEMNATSHSIVRLRILELVGKNEWMNEPENAISIAYYAFEYFLLFGKFPWISIEAFDHMRENRWHISPFVQSFFQVFYSFDIQGR
jgi:hypothetical protein